MPSRLIRMPMFASQWAKLTLVPLLLGPYLLMGCGSVSIKSAPDAAEVLVMIPGKSDPKILGKTPYEVKLSELGAAANAGPIVLQIRKAGYHPQFLYVPNVSGGKLEFSTNLKPTIVSNYSDINRIIKLTLLAERQLQMKQYDEAIKTAQLLKGINENIAVAWDIEGAAYLLKGDKTKSKLAWERSIEIDPENPDTAKMLNRMNASEGVKKQ
jgi:tetratricopeptide (TPR) repeat protein